MSQPDIEQLLSLLAAPAAEPSLAAQQCLRARMAEELRSLQAEREAAAMGLGLAYRFARHHLKERPLIYLVPGAAVITLAVRLALGESFIMLARMIAGR